MDRNLGDLYIPTPGAPVTPMPNALDPLFFLLVFSVEALIAAILIAGLWKIFTKAGQKGWKSLVPFYNTYILIKIANKPGSWFLLSFVPIVNAVVAILIMIELAKKFGKSPAFALLLTFLPFIGFPVLGFGKAQYNVAPPQSNASLTLQLEKANFFTRTSGNVIDLFIFLMFSIPLYFIITMIFDLFAPGSLEELGFQNQQIRQWMLAKEISFYIIMMVIITIYFTISEGKTGQSIGKKALGLHVVGMNMEKITMKQSFIRNSIRILDYILFPLSLILLAIGKSQRLGDLAAHTIVAKEVTTGSTTQTSIPPTPTTTSLPQQPPTVVPPVAPAPTSTSTQ